MPDKPITYVALETFSAELNGSPQMIHRGDTIEAGHPLLEGRMELFAPLEVAITHPWPGTRGVVEQATAAPGEKRAVALSPERPRQADVKSEKK